MTYASIEDYYWPFCFQQKSNASLPTENLLQQTLIYKAHIPSRESYSVELEFTLLSFSAEPKRNSALVCQQKQISHLTVFQFLSF